MATKKTMIANIEDLKDALSETRERWERTGKVSDDDLEPTYWCLADDYRGTDKGCAVEMMTYEMAQAVKRRFDGIKLFESNWKGRGRDSRCAPAKIWDGELKSRGTVIGRGCRYTHSY